MAEEGGAPSAEPSEPKAKAGQFSATGVQEVVDVAIAAATFAYECDAKATQASELMQSTSSTAQKAVGKVAEEVASRNVSADNIHNSASKTSEEAKALALTALQAVEKAANDAMMAHTAAEEASRKAQVAWSEAVHTNAARADFEIAAAKSRAEATKTMEEASSKAEEDAALRPSSEANAKAFLAKAAFARVTAAKAVSEQAAKSRGKATLSMEQAASDASGACVNQGAARKACEVVITSWELAAKLNAGLAIAQAAADAREASLKANKALEEAESQAVVARQVSIEASARVAAAKTKAIKMTSNRVAAESAESKATALHRSRTGAEAAELEVVAAVEALATEEAAAIEVEKVAAVKVEAAAQSRKVAQETKDAADQAIGVAKSTAAKKAELEKEKAGIAVFLAERQGVAAEKNATLAEAEDKAAKAAKAARGASKSGKALAERYEFDSKKADSIAAKARAAAKVVNDEVALHQAAIDAVQQKISDVEAEHEALAAKTNEQLQRFNMLDADAKQLEAVADTAKADAAAARQKAKDALAHKDAMVRKVDEEKTAKIADEKEAVEMAALIKESKQAEAEAIDELKKEEAAAQKANASFHSLDDGRKEADADAKAKHQLSMSAAADEKGEGRMKLEAVKSANAAAQKAALAVQMASKAAARAEASSGVAVDAHGAAEADAALAHTNDDRHAKRASATEARWCRLSGDGLRKALLGQWMQFTIEAFDETGSQQPDGGDTFLVCIRCTSQGTRIPAKIQDNGDGTYTVRFKPITWGMCSIAVSHLTNFSILGEPLPGSPFQCHISAVTPSPSHCLVEAPSESIVSCVPDHFLVSFRDESGALAHAHKSELEVLIQREDEYSSIGMPLTWRSPSQRASSPSEGRTAEEGAEEEGAEEEGVEEEKPEGGIPLDSIAEAEPPSTPVAEEGGEFEADVSTPSPSKSPRRPPRLTHVSPRKDIDRWARRVALDSERERERARERDQMYEWSRSDNGATSLMKTRTLFKLPSLYLQDLDMDPERIGFAYGGIEGGERHQSLHDQYKVAFSVAAVGKYVLHVRLRQNDKANKVPIPGSPLRFTVEPGRAYSLSTQIPPSELPLRGYLPAPSPAAADTADKSKLSASFLAPAEPTAPSQSAPPPAGLGETLHRQSSAAFATTVSRGRAPSQELIEPPPAMLPAAPPPLEPEEAIYKGFECSLRLQTRDKAGNKCTSSGGDVKCGVLDESLDIESTCIDLQDGTYQLRWRSLTPHPGVRVFVRIDGIHILGSPTTMELVDVEGDKKLASERKSSRKKKVSSGKKTSDKTAGAPGTEKPSPNKGTKKAEKTDKSARPDPPKVAAPEPSFKKPPEEDRHSFVRPRVSDGEGAERL